MSRVATMAFARGGSIRTLRRNDLAPGCVVHANSTPTWCVAPAPSTRLHLMTRTSSRYSTPPILHAKLRDRSLVNRTGRLEQAARPADVQRARVDVTLQHANQVGRREQCAELPLAARLTAPEATPLGSVRRRRIREQFQL